MGSGIKFNLHMHTTHSPCSDMDPKDLVERAVKKKLEVICIADHNTTNGAREAWEYQQKHALPIIIEFGYEATTDFGEVLLNFLSHEECDILDNRKKLKYDEGVCKFPTLYEIINYFKSKNSRILDAGNHMFQSAWKSKRKGLDLYKACGAKVDFDFKKRIIIIDKSKDKGEHIFNSVAEAANFLDYIELNGTNMSVKESLAAIIFAEAYGKPLVCNGDDHFLGQVGRRYSIAHKSNVREAILTNSLEIPFLPDNMGYIRKKLSYLLARYYRMFEGIRKNKSTSSNKS